MHTAKSKFSNIVIEYLGEINNRIKKLLKPIYQGSGWVQIMKKMEVEILATHSL